uniref:Uncharacterized protein n=1 Tax=Anguilla anguilla TaxID=7936 RepID=A0A0E9V3L6_ANGAN
MSLLLMGSSVILYAWSSMISFSS